MGDELEITPPHTSQCFNLLFWCLPVDCWQLSDRKMKRTRDARRTEVRSRVRVSVTFSLGRIMRIDSLLSSQDLVVSDTQGLSRNTDSRATTIGSLPA